MEIMKRLVREEEGQGLVEYVVDCRRCCGHCCRC